MFFFGIVNRLVKSFSVRSNKVLFIQNLENKDFKNCHLDLRSQFLVIFCPYGIYIVVQYNFENKTERFRGYAYNYLFKKLNLQKRHRFDVNQKSCFKFKIEIKIVFSHCVKNVLLSIFTRLENAVPKSVVAGPA